MESNLKGTSSAREERQREKQRLIEELHRKVSNKQLPETQARVQVPVGTGTVFHAT